jgi:hypothetical protein
LGYRFEENREVNISQPKDHHLRGFVLPEAGLFGKQETGLGHHFLTCHNQGTHMLVP